jgi:hypothetical protein
MQKMAEGKPVPQFKARKHDHMQDFFQAFNTLIAQWNARVSAGANGNPDPTILPRSSTNGTAPSAESEAVTEVQLNA